MVARVDGLRLRAATRGNGKAMGVAIKIQRNLVRSLSDSEIEAIADVIDAYGKRRYEQGFQVATEKRDPDELCPACGARLEGV